jgi:beta-mannosidase
MLTPSFGKVLLLTAGLPLCTTAQHVIDLSGNGWTVKNSEGNVSVPGSLPSQAHLDLFAANFICKSSQLHDS